MRIVYQTSSRSRWFFPGSVLIIFLALLVSACASSTTAGTGTPPASAVVNPPSNVATATPTQPPGVRLGAQPCPDKVKVLTYWNAYVQLAQGDHVYTVNCANLVGNPTVQALVTTICDCSGGFMSVYVFDGITTTPKALLHLDHLEKGDARVSNYNTVLTAEVDENSSINKKTTTNAGLTSDLYREFKWSDGAGALVQIGFSGIFPDMTRFQAELDQQQVNKGQDSWKLSPTQTALNFVQKLFKWHADSQATLTSGGKSTDTEAVVTVKNSGSRVVSHPLQVTLDRLEGNANGGIWIVTDAQSKGEQITTPKSAQSVANPIAVQGTAQGTNGTAGTLYVLDHLYTQIGQQVVDAKGNSVQQTLNATVGYTSTYKNGQEDGALLLFNTVNFDGSVVDLHIVKVLLNGK